MAYLVSKKQRILTTILILLVIGIQAQIVLATQSTNIRLALSDIIMLVAIPVAGVIGLRRLGSAGFLMILKAILPLILLVLLCIGHVGFEYINGAGIDSWAALKVIGTGIVAVYMTTAYFLVSSLKDQAEFPEANSILLRYVGLSLAILILAFAYFIWFLANPQEHHFLEFIGFDTPRRLNGFMGNPNAYGYFLTCVFLTYLAYLYSEAETLTKKHFLWLAIFALGVVFSGSRGALLALMFSAGCFGLFYFRRALVLGSVFLGCLSIPLLLSISSNVLLSGLEWIKPVVGLSGDVYRFIRNTLQKLDWGYFNTTSLFQGTDSGSSERWVSYKAAYEIWLENPIFGSGLGSFRHLASDFGLPQGLVVHNTGLWLLAELGVIGFALVAWLFVSLFRRFWRFRENPICLAMCMILVATVVMSQTSEIFYQRHLWFVLGVALAYQIFLEKKKSPQI